MTDQQETRHHVARSYQDAPTRTIAAAGASFAYRQLGPATGVPVIFLTHLAAVLDNWDPGSSTASPPNTGSSPSITGA